MKQTDPSKNINTDPRTSTMFFESVFFYEKHNKKNLGNNYMM